MGGKNQFATAPVVTPAQTAYTPSAFQTAAPSSPGKSPVAVAGLGAEHQPLRVHESGGEIHFHDDANGIRVNVPVADFFSAWEVLKNGEIRGPVRFTDKTNSTIVELFPHMTYSTVDIVVKVRRVEFGANFLNIEKLVNGQ